MKIRKKIVVLTGAGISAESGLQVFRGNNGLWNNYRIEEVATFEAWQENMELVLDFYNQRRKQLFEVVPNPAHYALKKLEEKFDVCIITQNVDNLHERAGSSNIIHLHGELTKARSTVNGNLVYEIDGWELKKGDKCELGSQLRPHIVWFGEMVPMIDIAIPLVAEARIIIIVGTSMQVYPAASLINYARSDAEIFCIDPQGYNGTQKKITVIQDNAASALPKLAEKLLNA